MSSKTPLQELIRIMEETMSDSRCDIIIARTIKANIKLAQSLLPKEKEDIMNAFDSGCELGIGYENAEDYFTNTFNQ